MTEDATKAAGSSTSATPQTSEEVEQHRIAEMAANADNLIKLASLGLKNVDLPKGLITIDGDTPIEGLLLAYQSVNAIASKIASHLVERKAKRVIIQNPVDFKVLDFARVFRTQLELLGKKLDALLTYAEKFEKLSRAADPSVKSFVPAVAIPVVGAAISSALQILSLFKVDVREKYSTITVESQTLNVAVAGALKKLPEKVKIEVFDTTIMPCPTPARESGFILKRLTILRETYLKLVVYRDDIVGRCNPPASQPLLDLKNQIVDVLAQFDAFVAALVKVDDASGASKLIQLLAAEGLEHLIGEHTFFLWLHPVAAGGGWQTRQNMVHSKTNFSGGAIVSFAIYDYERNLLEAAVIPHYSGFVPLDDNLPKGNLIS